jgi:hypothetical protein
MRISDEIRKLAGEAGIYSNACVKLRELADRIDSEMMELPRDRDGVPIRVGDTVYLDDGRKAEVRRIQISERENSICFDVCGDLFSFWPEHLTHTRPDSLESIAHELEVAKGWRDQNGEYNCNVSSVSTKTLGDWADRIRKLAERED